MASLMFSHSCLNGAVLFCRFQSVVCFALLSCCVTELETKGSICHVQMLGMTKKKQTKTMPHIMSSKQKTTIWNTSFANHA